MYDATAAHIVQTSQTGVSSWKPPRVFQRNNPVSVAQKTGGGMHEIFSLNYTHHKHHYISGMQQEQ